MKSFFTCLSVLLSSCVLAQGIPCVDGMAGPYPCSNVDMMSFIPINTFGAANLNDIWGWTESESGREFALVGLSNGTAFIEITVPESPVYIGILPTETSNSLWRDLKTHEDFCYIVSEAGGHGIQAFDLNLLIAADAQADEFPLTFEATGYTGMVGSAHNIVIDEESGYAYAVGANSANGGLVIFELNGAEMTLVGQFAEDGYTHDAQVVVYNGPDEDYQGQQIAFCANEDEITIVNVEDKSDCVLIDSQGYVGSEYTHQCWLTQDHKYLLANDELDELNNVTPTTRTLIWDVRDLDNIIYLDDFTTGSTAIDHNLYVENYFAYMSNYLSGLRVVDASDVELGEMQEIGFFDSQPGSDNASFQGTWSNYPYFPSGMVAMTDMYLGFFVLRPGGVASTSIVHGECGETSQEIYVDYSIAYDNADVFLTGLPEGVSVSYPFTINSPGRNPLILSGLDNLDPGEYDFNYEIQIDGETVVQTGTIIISNLEAPEAVSLTSPLATLIEAPTAVTFEWAASSEATEYLFELSSTDDFSDILVSETTAFTTTSVQSSTFTEGQEDYHWRVTISNDCGTTISETGSFEVLILSIGEELMERIAIYPNPASDRVQLQGVDLGSAYQLTDMAGKIILAGRLNAATLDINELAQGIYMLNVDGYSPTRLIKQ